MYQDEIYILWDGDCNNYGWHEGGPNCTLLKSGLMDHMVRLFVLGQKYQMPRLRNDSLDAIHIYVNDGGKPTVEALTHAVSK